MSTQFYRPFEVADLLGVSTATLRRWARQYRAWLSSDAGGDQPGSAAGGRHRRYARSDVQLLAHVKSLLQAGLTHDEIRQRLGERDDWAPPEIELADEEPMTRALVPHQETAALLPQSEMTQWLSQTLDTLSDSQQMLLSGQHTERQLLGVLLQDNFNLKDENNRLRERMLDSERRIYELKRELDQTREQDRERLRQLEAYMFELQRRLDALNQPTVLHEAPPAIPPAAAPAPAPESVAPPPPSPSAAASNDTPPPRRRGFWARLFRR